MADILLFNKPYNILCQFVDKHGRGTLADFIPTKEYQHFYPAGRLDIDSEGLLLLTDNGLLQHRITDPEKKFAKRYWVQLEGQIKTEQLQQLETGVNFPEGLTRPAKAREIPQPEIWPRSPPVRFRRKIPTCWIELTLTEGRNRQVRRMTAAVGHPTLRLIRISIGPWELHPLMPGEFRVEKVHLPM